MIADGFRKLAEFFLLIFAELGRNFDLDRDIEVALFEPDERAFYRYHEDTGLYTVESADLIKQARRELDGADAYVRSQRSAIARRLHAPGGLDDAATDRWIDKHLRGGGELFSALARRLPLARNTHEFLADAQALHDIRKDLLRDSQ